jgi:hypothetical protein
MERLDRRYVSWAPILTIAAVGFLLLLNNGCNDAGQMVDVNMSTNPGAGVTPVSTDPPDGGTPTPTPTDTNPDGGTPTPTPTSTPDGGTPTPTPAPTPNLACGVVVIRDLILSSNDPQSPQIHDRGWADLDLANPNGSTINNLGVAPGTYDRIRFTLHKRTGDGSSGPGTGDPSVNASIHLCGTWQGIKWDVFDDVTTNVDRKDAGGVTVDADGPGKLFIIFDSAHWFDGIDLSQAAVAADGTVYLSHDSNSQMAEKFKQNFETAIRIANQQHS